MDATPLSDALYTAVLHHGRVRNMANTNKYQLEPSCGLTGAIDNAIDESQEKVFEARKALFLVIHRFMALDGAQEILARIDPAINEALLREGNVQEWLSVAGPAISRFKFEIQQQERTEVAQMWARLGAKS